jgi:predicted metalloprotease with PDZ domain
MIRNRAQLASPECHAAISKSCFARRVTRLLLLLSGPAWAAPPQPSPEALSPALPAPQDRGFAGAIELAVDATNLNQHIVQVAETIPIQQGEHLVLLFPKWLPGNHGPTGPLRLLAGLTLTAGGKTLDWRRDSVDVGAFHVDAPAGVHAVEARFQFLSPLDSKDGRVVMTPNMVEVEWRQEVLFPAGFYQRDIPVHASIKLPDGFGFATALETAQDTGGTISFKPVTLETLLDSPVLAGRYFDRIDLDPGSRVPVHLDVVGDKPEDLAIKPEDLQAHRNLVQQAYRNFGSHHYDHYDFLLSVSDEMGGVGLEHQRSSEVGAVQDYFTDPQKSAPERDLLPHEYTHSWNGKFRRPADLWSPDEHTVPERDDLLWMYEGQTDYWGQVLAARSGILNASQVRDLLAIEAAELDAATPGRVWRNLQDTTNDPIISWQRPTRWSSWSRFVDYYPEGVLMWLDADTLIRDLSGGRKSLSDFARLFFGVDDGDWTIHPYGFDDVVHALNKVQPYDWAAFLRMRLDGHGPGAPLDGITRGGWKLVYTDSQSSMNKAFESLRKASDLTFSLGLAIGGDGTIRSVLWGGPAFKAGLAPDDKIAAVNSMALDGTGTLTSAVTAARAGTAPIELLVLNGGHYRTVRIDYHGGLRYPHLERLAKSPDRLDEILAAVK